jgi:hypothetical protein
MLIDDGWRGWLARDDDEEPLPPTPPTPKARHRIAEAVVIATLSAVTAKVVEHFYEAFKERRKSKAE